jgi:DNA invertase Pin-like site-specific DNA recombinase
MKKQVEVKRASATKPAAVYVRVSSKQQVEKVSLDEQVSTCEELCRSRGLEVGEVFREEGRSASKDTLDNRPVMSALLDRIDRGEFSALVAFAPNRISRNDLSAQVIILRLKIAGAILVTPEFTMNPQDPTERLTAYMQFWSAGRDSDARTSAIKMGKAGLRKRGHFPEARTPFGYHWQKAPRGVSGEGIPVLDEREASVVKLVFSLAEKGMRPQTIIGELTRRGVLTRSQQEWQEFREGKRAQPKRPPAAWELKTVTRMVSRREYIGEWRTDADTPWAEAPAPLTEKAVWRRAQAAITRKTVGRRRHKREFLLQGHLRCEKCGKRLTIAQPFEDIRYRYYRCSKGCRPFVPAGEIEQAAWAYVAERIRRPELVREAVEKYHEHGLEAWREELGTKELALAQIEVEVERVHQGYIDKVFTSEQVRERVGRYDEKRERLEAEAEALRGQITKGEMHEARLRGTEGLLRRLKDPDGMTFEEKRRVLDSLGVEIVLPKEESEKPAITWLGAALADEELDLRQQSASRQRPLALLADVIGD